VFQPQRVLDHDPCPLRRRGVRRGRCKTVLITHGESGRFGVGRARYVVAPTSLANQLEHNALGRQIAGGDLAGAPIPFLPVDKPTEAPVAATAVTGPPR